MPVITGIMREGLPEITWHFPVWHWAPRRGNPAQAHGEPYPSMGWIVEQVYELMWYRWTKQYGHADATRQWLVDYGMEVQYSKDKVEVKY